MVTQLEPFVPVCNINDTPVPGDLPARTNATRVPERAGVHDVTGSFQLSPTLIVAST